MKLKLLTWALIASIPISAIIGAGAIYALNELVQKSHRTTYTNEEEIAIYDRFIEMVSNNEIEPEAIKNAFASQRKARIAAHKIMDGSNEMRNNAIAALVSTVILQMMLLYAYFSKKSKT